MPSTSHQYLFLHWTAHKHCGTVIPLASLRRKSLYELSSPNRSHIHKSASSDNRMLLVAYKQLPWVTFGTDRLTCDCLTICTHFNVVTGSQDRLVSQRASGNLQPHSFTITSWWPVWRSREHEQSRRYISSRSVALNAQMTAIEVFLKIFDAKSVRRGCKWSAFTSKWGYDQLLT
jgi:hypothetical protein